LSIEKINTVNFIKLILFLLLICFTRPTGLLLIPCVAIYLIIKFFKRFSLILKIGICILIAVLFILVLNLALGSGGELNFILPLEQEHIICGVPTVNVNRSPSESSIGSIFSYIFQHPSQFLHLAWLRTLAFFGMIRSYFSIAHNL